MPKKNAAKYVEEEEEEEEVLGDSDDDEVDDDEIDGSSGDDEIGDDDENEDDLDSGEDEEAGTKEDDARLGKLESLWQQRFKNREMLETKKVLEGDEDERAEGDLSSDEEHEKNTIGNVPLRWYDEFDHIGYDKSGKKIIKKEGMDEVDKYLASQDDPNYRRSVYDEKNDTNVVLTDRELIMVRRILQSKFPEPGFNAEPDYIDYYTSVLEEAPLSAAPERKNRFIPSKWERMKVFSIVRAIREGRMSMTKTPKKEKPQFYLMWGEDDTVDDPLKRRKAPKHIPAPKVDPPDHRESYHPPTEYLPTEEEIKQWEEADPNRRKYNFIPKDYGTMRYIPRYENFVTERFERCLDLFLCPRAEERRLNIDPESLVPKLPSPNELRPYPTTVGVTYYGHIGRVRAIAVDPTGELMASGGDDQILRIWEVATGRCLAAYNVSSNLDRPWIKKTKVTIGENGEIIEEPNTEKEGEDNDEENEPKTGYETSEEKPPIMSIAWNPQSKYKVVAVAIANRVVLINAIASTAVSPEEAAETLALLSGSMKEPEEEVEADSDSEKEESEDEEQEIDEENMTEEQIEEIQRKRALKKSRDIAGWLENGDFSSPEALMEGSFCKTTILYKEKDQGNCVSVVWHAKGEYLASVCRSTKQSAQVTIHHVKKRLSQQPLAVKKTIEVQKVLFHPKKPILFVASRQSVAVYHLVRQVRISKLETPAKWISSIALHPKGDNLVIGSYDKRVSWFDLDISSKPWKTFKYHHRAVRRVDFHPRYPLMASCADDGVIHIFHARVFDDFNKDPFLVPVKILKGHAQTLEGLGVLDCVFHPTQPWIFSAGADGRVQLFQNIP